MDTYSPSRTVDRTDRRIGAQCAEDDIPGQSLLKEYEQRPMQCRVAREVYDEVQYSGRCQPQQERQVSYVVAEDYQRQEACRGVRSVTSDEVVYAARAADTSYNRNCASAYVNREAELAYSNRDYYTGAYGAGSYSNQPYDAAYYAPRPVAANYPYGRPYYIDRNQADSAYQQGAAPIVIVDRSPYEYERERHRGPGIVHALAGIAGIAGSVAFGMYGRNGGWGRNYGYGNCGNSWGSYNNWNNYSRHGYNNYGYNNGYGYDYGYGQQNWNNGWNNQRYHQNSSWAYPLAGLAMSIPQMINRNRHCNSGWNNVGFNRGFGNSFRGGWNRRGC